MGKKPIKRPVRIMCPMYRCARYTRSRPMRMVCKKHPKTGKRLCRGEMVPPKETCTTTYPKTKSAYGCIKHPCGLRVCKKFVPKAIAKRPCSAHKVRCMRKPLCTYSKGPIVNGCPKYMCGIAKCQKPIPSVKKPTKPTRIPKTGGVFPTVPKIGGQGGVAPTIPKKPTVGPKTIRVNKMPSPVHVHRYISKDGNVRMRSSVSY